MNPILLYYINNYITALISPRITVPCHILTSLPINTSPAIVAFGAIKTSDKTIGFKLYNLKIVLALEYFY
jgi:hypothetical protein